MLTKKKIQVTVTKEIVTDIICNCCARSLGGLQDDTEEITQHDSYVSLHSNWGWESPKDEEAHESLICEDCYDKFVATWKIPPTISRYGDSLEDFANSQE